MHGTQEARKEVMNIMTQGYKNLRFEYNLTADDPWGDTLSWHFAIAETLFHDGYKLPGEWKFHDSPLHGNWVPDDYQTEILREMLDLGNCDEDDLLAFGSVLFRYAGLLRAAGKDY